MLFNQTFPFSEDREFIWFKAGANDMKIEGPITFSFLFH